jgi:hypothetical protein
MSHEEVQQVGISSLIDTVTGKRLPVSPSQRLYGVAFSVENALTPAQIEALVARVAAEEVPPIAEVLLADAQHLATAGLQFASSDGLRAVLMAAIACEVKVKGNLRERASDEQKALIEYMLSNQREVTLTAAELFNKIMKASQGRSLRDADSKLFKEVTELFQLRNLVAHQGKPPTVEEARRLVGVAKRVFRWLDEKPESGS